MKNSNEGLAAAARKNFLEYGNWMELPQEEMESAFIDGAKFGGAEGYEMGRADGWLEVFEALMICPSIQRGTCKQWAVYIKRIGKRRGIL